ncbi:MAG: bifunctional folylpolyglutamate synthase/dihydrofolate synthase [Acidobacteria bacterium]|nr:bifunctional folylpolyglutamate synthase/dihydrofolate synthase [Acidobacteriota bacterium]
MTYPDSVRFLYALGNEVRSSRLGLERMTVLIEALGSPHRVGRFIHVAGTNGKGSVAAMIDAALRAAGLRTGLYTSPHLVEPTERIRIGGRSVGMEQFVWAFEQVHQAAEQLLREGRLEHHPTYFETVTAMAFVLFRAQAVKSAVLEVGLGGRLDATNVVTPRLCVITPIDFDHEAFLGKSLEAIAAEKAGILKPGVPAVFAAQRPEVVATLERAAAAAGIEPVWTSRWRAEEVALQADGSRFVAAGPRRIRLDCPLAGEHQIANTLTALTALDCLGVPDDAIRDGIRQTCWPGRLERVSTGPDILLDGAHNPAGAHALAAHITRFYSGRKVWLIYGAMRDKAVAEMSAILFPLAAQVIVTASDQPRAVRPELIRDLVSHPRLRIAPRLAEALEMARQAPPQDVVFVTGSLFLVGEARALLVQ